MIDVHCRSSPGTARQPRLLVSQVDCNSTVRKMRSKQSSRFLHVLCTQVSTVTLPVMHDDTARGGREGGGVLTEDAVPVPPVNQG